MYSGHLTRRDRNKIRAQIIYFCATPKTLQEIAKEFEISGISAGNFLGTLRWKGLCIWNPLKKTYQTKLASALTPAKKDDEDDGLPTWKVD
jgi:hypothetical protein